MTDTHRKATLADLASLEPDLTDHYIRILNELAEFGVERAEQVFAAARESDDADRAGTEPALTFEQAALEFERITSAVLLCVELSNKLYTDRLAREQKAAADGAVAETQLSPGLEDAIKEAIAQLAGPDKPTLH